MDGIKFYIMNILCACNHTVE